MPDEPRFDDLGALLADGDLPTDAETASAELFGLWQAEYDPAQGTWCQQAQAQALSCLTLSGTALGELRQLNRPAILLLTDSSGQSHEVTLSGLGYDHAELAVAGRMLRVSIAELTHYWYGEHRLLWKPMTDVSFDLTPGMRTERVAWLRESLATIRGTSVLSQDPTLYDAELVEWVRDYQRERRLGVDGVVGIRTQLALQADLERPGIPRLNLEH